MKHFVPDIKIDMLYAILQQAEAVVITVHPNGPNIRFRYISEAGEETMWDTVRMA